MKAETQRLQVAHMTPLHVQPCRRGRPRNEGLPPVCEAHNRCYSPRLGRCSYTAASAARLEAAWRESGGRTSTMAEIRRRFA